MNYRKKAEEFFETIAQRQNSLINIPINCSQGETGALLYLTFVQDGISPTKLAETLNVSLPRIASVLNSLQLKNLIQKMKDNKDKRKTVVHITERGKELILSKKKDAIDKISKIIEKLGEKDINLYMGLVKKIERIMEEIKEH